MSGNLVICPVYNEQDTIEKFCINLRKHYRGDILFIDDGSTDKSRNILKGLENEHTFLIRHSQRSGYGATLIAGFNFSRRNGYKKVITIDVDLQHSPEHIRRFLNALREYEVILGSRYISIDKFLDVPRSRLLINRYISKLLNILFAVNFTDPFCGYRGYRSAFLEKVHLREKSYGLSLEILLEIIRTKTKIKELPVPAIYLDRRRIFLDGLNDARIRLLYYLEIVSSKKKVIEDEKKIFDSQSSSG